MDLKSENPLISVYMPTCNRISLLPRAVQSVLNQDYDNIELIIVDDASIDETRDYLEKLKLSDCRVRTIYVAESKGPSHARNLAITAAEGEFITGIDDDDEFKNDRLTRFLDAWDKEYGFLTSSLYWDYGKSRKLLGGKNLEISLNDLLSHKYATNQVFTRKEYLLEAGLFDEHMRNSEDWDLWIRLALLQKPMKKLKEATYIINTAHDLPRLSVSTQMVDGLKRLIDKHRVHMTEKNKNDMAVRLAIQAHEYLSITELLKMLNRDNLGIYLKFWVRTKLPAVTNLIKRLIRRHK